MPDSSLWQKKQFIEVRKRTKEEVDEQDVSFDFVDFKDGTDRLGWLVTYSAITISDPESGAEISGVEYYFIQQDGSKFKALLKYNPFFYVITESGTEREVESVLRRKVSDKPLLMRTRRARRLHFDHPYLHHNPNCLIALALSSTRTRWQMLCTRKCGTWTSPTTWQDTSASFFSSNFATSTSSWRYLAYLLAGC